jgi:hypothetical protein
MVRALAGFVAFVVLMVGAGAWFKNGGKSLVVDQVYGMMDSSDSTAHLVQRFVDVAAPLYNHLVDRLRQAKVVAENTLREYVSNFAFSRLDAHEGGGGGGGVFRRRMGAAAAQGQGHQGPSPSPLEEDDGGGVARWENDTSIFGSVEIDRSQGRPREVFVPDPNAPTPTSAWPALVAELGPPDVLVGKPGGSAIWLRDTLRRAGKPFDRVELRDEQIPHGNPSNHAGFLYVELDGLRVPSDMMDYVMSLSGTITYDPLARRLRVRSFSLPVAKVIVYLVIALVERLMTPRQCIDRFHRHVAQTIDADDNPDYDPNAHMMYEERIAEYVASLPRKQQSRQRKKEKEYEQE